MKFRLMESIRCPACRGVLQLEAPTASRVERVAAALTPCEGRCPFPELFGCARDCSICGLYELTAGSLLCRACRRRYPLEGGIPRLCHVDSGQGDRVRARTAERYGYLWSRSSSAAEGEGPRPYHFERMAQALSLAPLQGLVLDAGCGEGIDLANQATRPGLEVVGVELSDGGCRASFQRSLPLPAASVLQADLTRLPFEDGCFDCVYSYGVLHHLRSPQQGLQELVRVLKAGGIAAVYLYEDFTERAAGWRWLLAAANSLRGLTTRLPPRLLYGLCQLGSPVIYALFTVPSRLLNRVAGLRRLGRGVPFRHAAGPFSLVGDLYDRFSAPVERRFSRTEVVALFEGVGLHRVAMTNERGWMVTGVKPALTGHGP